MTSLADRPGAVRFATFWHGPAFSPYEAAALLSFTRLGYPMVVYSYDAIAVLPDGVVRRDAREIAPPDAMAYFAVGGKPSISHFTDYFRFLIFTKTDEVWVDTDIVLLRRFELDVSGNLMGQETPASVCNAVLRLDTADPRLAAIIARIEALSRKKLMHGDTGPRLLTATYGVETGVPQHVFYPVHFDDYWKVFLPAFRDECAALCADATTLHLWNNLVVRMGLWKDIGPPVGSFLHDVFARSGATALFDRFYPASVMQAMVRNAVETAGDDAGFKKVARMIVPSLKTSILRRWPNLNH